MPLPEFSKKTALRGRRPKVVEEAIDTFRTAPDEIRDAYRYTAAANHLIDQSVGKVIETLKELDMYDETIIIFTSDHGDFLGDLDMVAKFDIAMDNLLHLPFILKPAQSNKMAPAVIDTPMSNADVLPTLMHMVGLAPEEYIQGIDIFGEQASENRPMATCYTARGGTRNLTLYTETHRYTCYTDTGEEELYDHRDDPAELNNRADNPAETDRKLCDELRQELFGKHISCDSGIFNHYGLW